MDGIFKPAGTGAFVSVKDQAALATVDVSALTLGTFAYVIADNAYFQLVDVADTLTWQQASFAQFEYATAPDLPDADITIDPQGDAYGLYGIDLGTITADRTITLSPANSTSGYLFYIHARFAFGTASHNVTIKDGAAATLTVLSTSVNTVNGFKFNGTTSQYELFSWSYTKRVA